MESPATTARDTDSDRRGLGASGGGRNPHPSIHPSWVQLQNKSQRRDDDDYYGRTGHKTQERTKQAKKHQWKKGEEGDKALLFSL